MNGAELKAIERALETHVGYIRQDIGKVETRVGNIEDKLTDPESEIVKTCVRSKLNSDRIRTLWKVLAVVGSIALVVFGAWIRGEI